MTVLSPISTQNVGYNTLILQVGSYNQLKLTTEQQAIANDFQQKVNSVNLESDKYVDLRTDLDSVVKYLTRHQNRVQTIRDKVNELITLNWKAQYWGDDVSRPAYARAFDAVLNSINDTAENTSDIQNLLGSSEVSSYSYYSTISGQTETVTRTFLGTDYSIVDSGGNTWKRDPDYSRMLKQYDSTGAETGKSASISGGLRLDSLSDTTVNFTIMPDTSSEESFTGTLSRSGLQFLDAWLYGELATSDGWTRASTDLNHAKVTIDAHLPRFKAAVETAQFYYNKADTAISGFRTLVDDYTIAQAIELQEAESAYQAENALSYSAVSNTQSLRNEYTKLLSATGLSPLFKSLISLYA